MSLKNIPLKELKDELARREATAGILRPTLKTKPDFTELVELCKQYMGFLDSDDYCEDNDFSQYIFETALTALYGKGVFDYIKFIQVMNSGKLLFATEDSLMLQHADPRLVGGTEEETESE